MKIQTAEKSTISVTKSWYAIRLLCAMVVIGMTTGLAIAILALPPHAHGLEPAVTARMADSGVSHSVTAVLLNFRGYDTLLEMAVLLMALIGAWSLTSIREVPLPAPGAVLDYLARLLAPLIVMTVGYLIWAGSHAPGGAFQAGALLAALGVLLNLSGWRPPIDSSNIYLRCLLAAGLWAFLLAAASGWINGATYFFSYPPDQAGMLILLIEIFAALSIGATLAALFLLGRVEARS